MAQTPHFAVEPNWRDLHRFNLRLCAAVPLRHWLLRDGSLTAALTQLAGGNLTVEVVRQQIAPVRPSEARALKVRFPSQALVREVILKGEGEPWIFARSLIALTHLNGELRRLRQQGQVPLGHFLFRQRSLSRTPFELAAIEARHQYAPATALQDQPALARRSVFSIKQHPLLVSEVYLPALVARILAANSTPKSASIRHV